MGDSRYQETLRKWAERYVPKGAKVTKVEFHYDDGYDETYGYGPASLRVTISYGSGRLVHPDDFNDAAHVARDLGELLTGLFAIEDEEEK